MEDLLQSYSNQLKIESIGSSSKEILKESSSN